MQCWFNVVSMSDTDIVSTLYNVENPTPDFVSLSTSDQRYFNGDPQRWNNVGPTLKCSIGITQTTKSSIYQTIFQRRINVVTTLWINVEITLIQHRKWNKVRRRFISVAQRWYNVGLRRWINVKTTLYQRCFNVASMFLKLNQNQSGYWLWTSKFLNFNSRTSKKSLKSLKMWNQHIVYLEKRSMVL